MYAIYTYIEYIYIIIDAECTSILQYYHNYANNTTQHYNLYRIILLYTILYPIYYYTVYT